MVQEEAKKIKAYAIVPPMFDPNQRKLRFSNCNGLIKGTLSEYKELKQVVDWSPQEQAVFKEKYLERPKQFGHVADLLDKKVQVTEDHSYASDERYMRVKR